MGGTHCKSVGAAFEGSNHSLPKHVCFKIKKLTTEKVFNNLKKAAEFTGAGTVDKKIGQLAELLSSASPLEARYIIRTVLEQLRTGTASGTIRDAIVWAFFAKELEINKEENKLEISDRETYNKYVDAVQQAYDITNDFAVVAEIAKKLGLSPKTKFVGNVFSFDELPKYYSVADFFVLPSRTENFPLVLLEAMSSGKPVISSNIPGVRTLVDDGIDGFLVEPDNIISLTNKIQYLLENEKTRITMGKNARKKIEKEYIWEKIVLKLEKTYIEALS